jgi:lipoprotein-anchoring transpeptidase ErfK/SrfK
MKVKTNLVFSLASSLVGLCVSPAFAAPVPTPASVPAPVTELTPEIVNDTSLAEPVGAGASHAAVLRAQVLLDRAHFSAGEIDGSFGSRMQEAISAYQNANGLNPSGTIDAPTWAALDTDAAPVLSTYEIAAADVAGPFVVIPADMMAKAKMPALGYSSATEALGEKFHVSPNLLQKLNPDKKLDRVGESIVVPNVESSTPLPAAAKVVVDRSDSSVSLVDATDKTIARYPASTGSEHDPLPDGDWTVVDISRNPVFHYNPALFWDANSKHSKAEIPAGPNNPVGVVWVGLSKEHYGIHGTPEPSKIGKTESHGCIRLSNWDASEFANAVSAGMPAVLQE